MDVYDTTKQGLFDVLQEELKSLDLDVDNMSGQRYDNGSNMSILFRLWLSQSGFDTMGYGMVLSSSSRFFFGELSSASIQHLLILQRGGKFLKIILVDKLSKSYILIYSLGESC